MHTRSALCLSIRNLTGYERENVCTSVLSLHSYTKRNSLHLFLHYLYLPLNLRSARLITLFVTFSSLIHRLTSQVYNVRSFTSQKFQIRWVVCKKKCCKYSPVGRARGVRGRAGATRAAAGPAAWRHTHYTRLYSVPAQRANCVHN